MKFRLFILLFSITFSSVLYANGGEKQFIEDLCKSNPYNHSRRGLMSPVNGPATVTIFCEANFYDNMIGKISYNPKSQQNSVDVGPTVSNEYFQFTYSINKQKFLNSSNSCSSKPCPNTIQLMIFEEEWRITELNLESFDLVEIPASINNLDQLRVLNLNFNRLSDLPSLDNLNKLQFLSLQANMFKHLPESIQNLTQLEMLDISKHFSYAGPDLKTLPSFLSQLENLRALYVRQQGLEIFPEVVLELGKLEVLDLYMNPFTVGSIPPLNKLINLKYIDLPYGQCPQDPASLGIDTGKVNVTCGAY